jgi:hypothetical protein
MRYKGGVISATAPTTSISAATGVWTLQQQLQAIAAGKWTGIPLVIGQAYEGGYYAGKISTAGNGIADYNLVIGPASSAYNSAKKWKSSNSDTVGSDSVFNGTQNTADMVADGNATVYPAAHFCNDLVVGGFTDWYMPAKNELEICYYNLKPFNTNNTTAAGINPNAVPARASNYTTGNPAQTSAAVFKTSTGAEAFSRQDYWSSTEYDVNNTRAWRQYFYSGDQNANDSFSNKTYANAVRAIRRVAI